MTTARDPIPPTAHIPHIIIVEDEPVIASLLADVFTRFGYRVTQSHRVDEALEAIARSPDLAACISDFLLPDRTGLDLARELHLRRPGLPIVLISAYLEPELVARIQEEPSVALVVRKPLNIFALKDQVDRLLGRTTAGAGPPGGLKTWEASC